MLGLFVSAALSSLLFYGIYCFLLLPAVLSVLLLHIFSLSFTSDLLPTCMFLSAHTHSLSPFFCLSRTYNIHSPFLCLSSSLSPPFLLFPLALSISPTQSLLSHGSRCSIRCLLHSACGLARKAHEPSRMHQPCQTPHPHNSSLWTQQQTTQTLLKNTFCWPTLSGTLFPNGSG